MWWLPACAAPGELAVPYPPAVLMPTETLAGPISWTLDFEASDDCGYSRSYSGVEDRSIPWACPTCEHIYMADLTIAHSECRARITAEEASLTEWLGFGADAWYRASSPSYPLSEQGAATVSAVDVAVSSVSPPATSETTGDTYTLSTEGTLLRGEIVSDPWHGLKPPDAYVCGWPKADPPDYAGDYLLDVGKPVPDAIFMDRCAQGLRLADLEGRYVVLSVGAMDCGPCQSAAAGEEAFVADLAKAGVEVMVVTLLAPTLDDVLGETSVNQLTDWTESFALSGPVVWDRGWGVWVVGEALGNNFAYPAWVVLTPTGKVLSLSSGFGSWDEFADEVLAHANG